MERELGAWVLTDLRLGDCFDVLPTLDPESIDSCVTDPPYGISFMGKHWDRGAIEERVGKRDVSHLGRLTGGKDDEGRKITARTASAFATPASAAGAYDFSAKGNRAFQEWCRQWGELAFAAMKPGAHAVVFGGTRTYHRLAAGLEDAGFEIRDTLCWLFGQGFPKSLNLDGEYEGWGTALKPAFEPIVLARKPLAGTVAATVSEHGTGALNINGCRIPVVDREEYEHNHSGDRGHAGTRSKDARGATDLRPGGGSAADARWPANVVVDVDAAALIDEQSGTLVSGANPTRRGSDKFRDVYGDFVGQEECEPKRGLDKGGASRFFYCAKVSRAERNAGLEPSLLNPHGFEPRSLNWSNGEESPGTFQAEGTDRSARNFHPTVKPIALMRWLCRLVTPPGGALLDPFMGSGTTGIAAGLEGFIFTGIEQDESYMRIAEARIAHWLTTPVEAACAP